MSGYWVQKQYFPCTVLYYIYYTVSIANSAVFIIWVNTKSTHEYSHSPASFHSPRLCGRWDAGPQLFARCLHFENGRSLGQVSLRYHHSHQKMLEWLLCGNDPAVWIFFTWVGSTDLHSFFPDEKGHQIHGVWGRSPRPRLCAEQPKIQPELQRQLPIFTPGRKTDKTVRHCTVPVPFFFGNVWPLEGFRKDEIWWVNQRCPLRRT